MKISFRTLSFSIFSLLSASVFLSSCTDTEETAAESDRTLQLTEAEYRTGTYDIEMPCVNGATMTVDVNPVGEAGGALTGVLRVNGVTTPIGIDFDAAGSNPLEGTLTIAFEDTPSALAVLDAAGVTDVAVYEGGEGAVVDLAGVEIEFLLTYTANSSQFARVDAESRDLRNFIGTWTSFQGFPKTGPEARLYIWVNYDMLRGNYLILPQNN